MTSKGTLAENSHESVIRNQEKGLVWLIRFWIFLLSIIPNLVKEQIRASGQYFHALIPRIELAKVGISALYLFLKRDWVEDERCGRKGNIIENYSQSRLLSVGLVIQFL